jgi:hypothetical protein
VLSWCNIKQGRNELQGPVHSGQRRYHHKPPWHIPPAGCQQLKKNEIFYLVHDHFFGDERLIPGFCVRPEISISVGEWETPHFYSLQTGDFSGCLACPYKIEKAVTFPWRVQTSFIQMACFNAAPVADMLWLLSPKARALTRFMVGLRFCIIG